MSYRRRCEAVANAEARVAERIRRARAEWAALRANRDSAAYPGAVVGGGCT